VRAIAVRCVPSKVKLGEPFQVEVTLTHAPEQRYELGALGDLGDFELVRQERSRVDASDRSTTTLTVTLVGFALGPQTTPPLPLEMTAAEGQARLEAPGAAIEVVSTLPPDAQAKGEELLDVRPPEEVPVRSWTLAIWAGGLALAVLLGLLARWAWKRRGAVVAPPPPPEPPQVRAMRALDALKAEALPERGAFTSYYFRLSLILRAYLGERFTIEALECTTPELLAVLESRPRPGLDLDLIRDFAWSSDFARYAREEPSVAQCQAHLEHCYRVVQTTTSALALRPPAPGGPGGAA
jgi:hypothetical protein